MNRRPRLLTRAATRLRRPNLRRRLAAVLGLGAMTVLAACSGGAGASPAPSAPAAAVTIGGMGFSPSTITVKAGATVTWTWSGRTHDVRFTDGPASPVQSQGTWSRTFTTPGTYHYRCDLHPMMTGTVVVT
jgi:plastocyanin